MRAKYVKKGTFQEFFLEQNTPLNKAPIHSRFYRTDIHSLFPSLLTLDLFLILCAVASTSKHSIGLLYHIPLLIFEYKKRGSTTPLHPHIKLQSKHDCT